jgi:hypothetical protein
MRVFLIITSLVFSAFIAVVAYAQSGTGCYYGDRNGQIATSEISRTEQATYDAFIEIMEREPAGCEDSENSGLNLTGHCCFQVGGDFGGGGAQVVCQIGIWFDVHSGSAGVWNYEGTWDVICDFDADGIVDDDDNCLSTPNPNQENSYPPQGNGIGDACDCEGNFDCDGDCDGTDAATFKIDFGRSTFENPCETGNSCNGDFDCDGDCDGTDAALFKQDFGRSGFNNPCPVCVVGAWCSYPSP